MESEEESERSQRKGKRESEYLESGKESESSKRKGKRESEFVESGEDSGASKRVNSENVGPKSGKKKRKLFNSFCDDLMDEKGEIRQQVMFHHFFKPCLLQTSLPAKKVKRPKNRHDLLETAADHEKSREFNPDLNMVMLFSPLKLRRKA